jgi:rhodanese-related sulfurtransferase
MDQNFDISASQLKELLEGEEKIVLFDVRNPDEFEEDNLGGILVPLGDLPDSLDQFEEFQGQDIYIHCRSGARSDRAKQYLIANGYEKVHNVLGGILAYRSL